MSDGPAFGPGDLDRVARDLFGDRYQAPLARALGVSAATVSRWLPAGTTGEHRIPGPVVAAVSAWAEDLRLTGRRPPVSPGSEERYDPGTLRHRTGPRSKYVRLLG